MPGRKTVEQAVKGKAVMKQVITASTFALALGAAVFAQNPQFEVASIKPSAEQTANGGVTAGARITGSQMRMIGLTVKDYVAMAYGLRGPQVIAPEQLVAQRFDISANMPDGSTREQLPAMVKDLLEKRFQLKAHIEKREFPVYALTVGRNGLKIKESAPDTTAPGATGAINVGGSGSAAGVNLDLGGGTSFSLADNKISAKNITMAQLAETLTRFADRDVTDATGLTGRYDFVVTLTPEEYQATLIRSAINAGVVLPPQARLLLDAGPSNPLAPALDQTGLAFESRRAPLDVVVVDSIAKAPTEN
jgi:uncharacterized protein (TIGR03435 family)